MKAARTKLRMTAGPASSMAAAVPSRRPVPIEPPTATMVICAALSWWRRPNSGSVAGEAMVVCTGKAMPASSGSSRYADPSSDVATASASGAFIIRSRNLRLYYCCDAREPCSVRSISPLHKVGSEARTVYPAGTDEQPLVGERERERNHRELPMPLGISHTGDAHLDEDRYFGDTARCLE